MRAWICGLLTLLIAAPVSAAGLNRHHLPEATRWVIHVDVDAGWKTRGGEQCQKSEKAQAAIKKVQEKTGIDLGKDLHGLTVFGTTFAPHTGVLVAYVDVDRERIAGLLKQKPGYESSKHGPHVVHKFTEHKGKPFEHTVHACLHSDGVHVFGRHLEEVTAAIDQLDGKTKSLAGSDSPLVQDVTAGTTILARAVGLADAKLDTRARSLKQLKQLSITLGEHEGQSFAKATAVAVSGEVAQQLKSVAEGFKALALLRAGDNADAKKLIESGSLTVVDQTISLDWKASAELVQQVLKKEAEKHRAQWQKHREQWQKKGEKKPEAGEK